MATTIQVSDGVHVKLTAYRDRHEHTSMDSALREILREVDHE